jgi:hypothetical protein
MSRNLQYLLAFVVVAALAVGYFLVSYRGPGGTNAFLPNESAAMDQKDQEEKIVAAALCYQLKQQPAAIQGRVFFLFTGDRKDPSDSLLGKVRCGAQDVRKVSESTLDSGTVKDKKTGEEGVILGVRSIKWVTETEVIASGNIQSDIENSLTHAVRLVKDQNSRWIVKEMTVTEET